MRVIQLIVLLFADGVCISINFYYQLVIVRVTVLSKFVFIYMPFGRIDSVLTTVEIGVCKCNPDSFRDCPSTTVTCPLLLMWANTSQYLDTEGASSNPSP